MRVHGSILNAWGISYMCQPIPHASYAITTHDADSYANGPFARAVLIPIREFSFGAHYLAQMHDIPRTIAEHVSLLFGVHYEMLEWEAYDESGTRRRHVAPGGGL